MRCICILFLLLGLGSWCQAQPGSHPLERAHHHQQSGEFEQALPYLQQAAEQGSAPAQYELGIAYHNGQGTSRNDTLAVEWLIKAARQQHAPAHVALASKLWYSGLISRKQVLAWLQASAAAGDFPSLVYLQYHCDSTYADSPAPPLAAYPLQLSKQVAAYVSAATPADSTTIMQQALRLGTWYKKGYRLKADPVESYCWYLLMNEMRTTSAHILWVEAMRQVAALHQQLTPTQRALALRRAETVGNRKLRRLSQFNQAIARFQPTSPSAPATSN
ncbi:sel1 repeat family protein [Hymenobacter sediminis]|uniref:tetratricopeptide repeat protein n=1 Tax=Hymenobacter sediminis TaxID=2218621 RepID=UPI000DA67D22|nr:tetratricopeptide repeat protein [Hymenobacter sediminis]RPD48013.1 sel1 repeat family protein [Hymenobacter sediminis]